MTKNRLAVTPPQKPSLRARLGRKEGESFLRYLHPLVGSVSIAFAAIWTLLEALIAFFSALEIQGAQKYLLYALASFLIGGVIYLRDHLSPVEVSFLLPNSKTRLTLRYGDFFAENAHKVIAVNDFFDGQFHGIISENTIHGQFLQRECGGDPDQFRELIAGRFSDEPIEVVSRDKGNLERYPLGTTAIVERGKDKYFLVALTRTDPANHRVDCNLSDLAQVLDTLWRTVRENANMREVAVPLIGAGISGIGLQPRATLDLLVMSIVEADKKTELTKEIRIILHPNEIKRLDLRRIEDDWKRIA